MRRKNKFQRQSIYSNNQSQEDLARSGLVNAAFGIKHLRKGC